MVFYPSEEWITEFCRALNECEDLEAFGFSEDILLVITDLGLDRLTVADIAPALLDDVPESVLADLEDVSLSELIAETDAEMRSSLPDPVGRLLDQSERNVVDDALYVYIGLDEGKCFGPALVDDPDAVDYECVFRAPATVWQSIIDGRPAAAAALSGDLEIIGNPAFLFKYVAELQLIGDVAARNVDSEFLFDRPTPSLLTTAFDESLRFPILVQKSLTRESVLAARRLTPF